MRPTTLGSIIVVCLLIVVYNLVNPAGPQNQQHAPTDRTVKVSLPADQEPEIPNPNPRVEELNRATAILEEAEQRFVSEEDKKFVTIAVLDLAQAMISEQHVLETTLSTERFDDALATMFVDPNDPNSPMKENVYEDLNIAVRGMSKRTMEIFQVTEDDPAFAQRPKQEWKTAHIFLRVERTLDDGIKRISGVIISAPEPKYDSAIEVPFPPSGSVKTF